MLVDLPIVIIFDANGITQRELERCASARVCTLRFDADDYNVPGKLFDHYPPKEGQEHLAEPGDPVLTALSSRALDTIKKRAARSPIEYMVGTQQEREIAQEEADELVAQNGQFGAGA